MPSLLQKFKNPGSSNWSNLRYSASSRTDVPHLRDADLDDPKLQGWIWVPWLTSQEPSLPVQLLPFFLRRLSKQVFIFEILKGVWTCKESSYLMFQMDIVQLWKAISHHFEILRHPRWIAWFCLRSFVGHLVSAGYRFTPWPHCDCFVSRFQAWTIRQVMFAACSWKRVTRLQDACSPSEGKEQIRSDQRWSIWNLDFVFLLSDCQHCAAASMRWLQGGGLHVEAKGEASERPNPVLNRPSIFLKSCFRCFWLWFYV